ncbi:hypothetical protein EUGRSUZ_B01545 [Eucalyptus grandis]|uniref:Uncharacterized protein n=2 Tax=Eucalyptus grandis TaxID=71139 RepID=A0ACC3LQM3_EUCGR|nr:hypothetical protein EUGRSUZ_B01545 [Eucalyptus grandis]
MKIEMDSGMKRLVVVVVVVLVEMKDHFNPQNPTKKGGKKTLSIEEQTTEAILSPADANMQSTIRKETTHNSKVVSLFLSLFPKG